MTISTGRVQGPTLGFLVAKEKAINRFVPKPFWELKAYINLNGSLEAKYENKIIKTKSEATAVINKCKGKDGQVEKIDIKQFSKMPPTPFNLGTLQNEAYTLFGYLPRYTLNIVQHLYLEALISYPRTDSQKLPPTINFTKILRNLSKTPEYRRYSIELLKRKKLSPHNGKKDDPAHPAIYPTGNVPEKNLLSSEKKVLDLIIRRFMAVFGKPTIKKSIKVTININKNRFHLNGIQTLNEGWQFFYKPYIRSVDILLPQLEVGQTVKVLSIVSNEKFTKPPSRYNPSSLLKRMEEKGIGTKSTRTGIIQTLYNRKYITHEKMVVTDLGMKVFEILKKYCPIVVSIKLTSSLEEKMKKIREKNEKREIILKNVIVTLDSFIYTFKQNEKKIGEKLSSAIKKFTLENRVIGPCPVCITGKIIIQYSKKTGKRFIGCTNYFEKKCTTSFSLPQKGAIKPHTKKCHKCGWPTVRIETKRKIQWILCFNPVCSRNKKKRNT
jgi:DNA topoisomerase-1